MRLSELLRAVQSRFPSSQIWTDGDAIVRRDPDGSTVEVDLYLLWRLNSESQVVDAVCTSLGEGHDARTWISDAPLVKGGQGRTDEDVETTASTMVSMILIWGLLLAFCLVVWFLVLRHFF
jgi:hypothetical protein